DVNVDGPRGEAFVEDPGPFVDQGVNRPLDDLAGADWPALDARGVGTVGDEPLDRGIGERLAAPLRLPVPPPPRPPPPPPLRPTRRGSSGRSGPARRARPRPGAAAYPGARGGGPPCGSASPRRDRPGRRRPAGPSPCRNRPAPRPLPRRGHPPRPETGPRADR